MQNNNNNDQANRNNRRADPAERRAPFVRDEYRAHIDRLEEERRANRLNQLRQEQETRASEARALLDQAREAERRAQIALQEAQARLASSIQQSERLNQVVDDIRDVQLMSYAVASEEFGSMLREENDILMREFLGFLSRSLLDIDAGEIQQILDLIHKKPREVFEREGGNRDVFDYSYYEVLRFFAIVNDGLDIATGSMRGGNERVLKVSEIVWQNGLANFVKKEHSDGHIETDIASLFINRPTRLIFRTSRSEIEFLIEYAIKVVSGNIADLEPKIKLYVEYYVGRAIFTSITIDSLQADIQRNAANPREGISQEDADTLTVGQDLLNRVWNVVLTILSIMNRVMASNIHLTDVIIAQSKYRYVERYLGGLTPADRYGIVNSIQAFPFIICKAKEGDFDLNSELIFTDLHSKLRYLKTTYYDTKPEDWEENTLWVKIRIKTIHRQDQIEGDSIYESKSSVITIYPIAEYLAFNDGETIASALDVLVDDINVFKLEFERMLQAKLDGMQQQYGTFEVLDNSNTVDLTSVMIAYTQMSVRIKGGVDTNPNSEVNKPYIEVNSTILKPAYCKTASDSLIKKCAYYTECTNMGICLYEALWTYINLESINSRAKRGDRSFRKMTDRKVLILEDLGAEEDEIKDIVLLGDTTKFVKLCDENNIQTYFWEAGSNPLELNTSKPTLLIFSKHCICAKTDNIVQEYQRKQRQMVREKEQIYKCMPLPPPEDIPQMLNYYLDIETSIDKETGKFTPYLICVVGEGEEHAWWGKDTCKDRFLEWLGGLVDEEFNTSVGHKANKPKVSIWTYNGMKFDLIFLVRSMVRLPHFELKGSIDNIKALDICNVTFRDLLKLVPIGSLRKQSEFWKTEHKKGVENFDEITDEFIESIEGAGNLTDQFEVERLCNRQQEITDYCILDCVVLKECVESYIQWVWSNLKINPYAISTAGLALRYFQTHHHPAINKQDSKKPNPLKFIYGMPRDEYDAVKQSYKGGLVMNLKQTNRLDIITEVNESEEEDQPKTDQMLEEAKELRTIIKQKIVEAEGVEEKVNEYKNDLKGLEEVIVNMITKGTIKGSDWTVIMAMLNDINSSYPHCMLFRIPTKFKNKITYEYGGISIVSDYANFVDWYLYQVINLKWKDDTYVPTIPKRTPDGLNNTIVHDEVDYIWGVELKSALATGMVERGYAKICYEYEADFIFGSYVDELYNNRRKKCKETGDTQGDKLYKLLLNSLYGKFGQKLYPNKKIVDETGLLYYADKIITPPTFLGGGLYSIIVDENNESDNDSDFYHNEEDIDMTKRGNGHIGYCIHVASYIAALGRVGLIKGMMAVGPENVLYMDTDSLVTTVPLPEDMINPTELGKWAVEKKNIHTFISPCKKMYYMEGVNDDGTTFVVSKSKGLTTGSLAKNDYIRLVKEGKIEGIKGGDKWVRKDGFVRKLPNNKSLKLGSHREFFNNGFSSRPLYK